MAGFAQRQPFEANIPQPNTFMNFKAPLPVREEKKIANSSNNNYCYCDLGVQI